MLFYKSKFKVLSTETGQYIVFIVPLAELKKMKSFKRDEKLVVISE